MFIAITCTPQVERLAGVTRSRGAYRGEMDNNHDPVFSVPVHHVPIGGLDILSDGE